jgi:ribosomal protein S18 acetylase RimI-like enzyme
MISIVDASPATLTGIVSLHERAFPGFLMTMLGRSFLRVYYETSLEYVGTVALTAQEEGDTVGFVVGYIAPEGFYALLRRRRWRLATAAVRAVLRAPNLLPRVFGDMRRVSRSAEPSSPPGLRAELASIGVPPAASGKGLGRMLAEAFVQRARARGAEYVYLTTDAENNDKVNAFYCRMRFTRSRTFLGPGGRLMNEYVSPLDERSGCGPLATMDTWEASVSPHSPPT